MKPPPTAYDEVPYDARPVLGTCPRRLALCSLLHGGPRPPLDRFRALEIGCNNAHNLLPLAFYHPGASFLGVDSATTALAAGRAAAAETGLDNLTLEWMDLKAPSTLAGTFDYVIVHGVFSWVDAEVRRRILELCAAHVAPGGLVYLSHNVDAGWRVRGLVRDAVLAAASGAPTAAEANRRARERAEVLHAIVRDESEHPYHALLNEELQRVVGSTESYLAHETLSPVNVAFRHDEVVSMLAEHGFCYLADALYDRPEGRTPDALADALAQAGVTGAEQEQLADVLGYRRFRSSVFCRNEARADTASQRALVALDDMFASSTSHEPQEDEALIDEEFSLPADAQLAAALLLLAAESPRGVRVLDLIAKSKRVIDSEPMQDAAIRRRLLALHQRGRVGLDLLAPPPVAQAGVPHRLARYQAANGHELTTASHTALGPEPVDRAIIALLAAGMDVGAVAGEMHRLLTAGELTLPEGVAGDAPGAVLDAAVRECVDTLANWGLLE